MKIKILNLVQLNVKELVATVKTVDFVIIIFSLLRTLSVTIIPLTSLVICFNNNASSLGQCPSLTVQNNHPYI